MERATAKMAGKLAGAILRYGKVNAYRTGEASFRDYCDLATGSELSTGELDKLATMVEKRVVAQYRAYEGRDDQ